MKSRSILPFASRPSRHTRSIFLPVPASTRTTPGNCSLPVNLMTISKAEDREENETTKRKTIITSSKKGCLFFCLRVRDFKERFPASSCLQQPPGQDSGGWWRNEVKKPAPPYHVRTFSFWVPQVSLYKGKIYG